MEKLETLLEWGGIKKDAVLLLISGLALLASFLAPESLGWDPAWIAILLCGIPIVLEAIIGLVTRFDIKADVLVSIALVASIVIGEGFAAGEVAFIMQLGALLEDLTVAKARAGMERLVHLTPRTARVLRDGSEQILPADEVSVGDRLRVLPGEIIPADGFIRSGHTSVNQAVMTGEALPVDLGPGDPVSSGTLNQFGAFEMEASRVGEDSSIQRMIRLVQSADAGKAKIVSIADRWATWIVVIALTSAVLTWLITRQPIRSVTILVVFCPCALVLATPTAIMAAIGNATRHGVLVREGDALERLSGVSVCTFDKTGTLTFGTPRVVAVVSLLPALSREALYALAAEAELHSEHPIGKAIVQSYREETQQPVPAAEAFRMLPGRGITATCRGRRLLAGNRLLLQENGVALTPEVSHAAHDFEAQGCTITYLSVDGQPAGFLALADTLRPEAPPMIRRLQQAGIRPILLTGDHPQAARHIAALLSISDVEAECLPEDKLRHIACMQQQEPICMVGDGINDAPALKMACVGIAMGGIGSDIAVDAADMALVNDDIRQLPHLFLLSRKMMRTIRWNLTFSMLLNVAAILLAMTGALNPIVGALVHNAGSVFVIVHSSLLLKWRMRD